MTPLQQQIAVQASKFDREVEMLMIQLEHIDGADDPAFEAVQLAAVQAKRVRRASTILTKTISQFRDNLQPGGTR